MSDQFKVVLRIIGVLSLLPLFFWALGNTQVAILSLSLVPLFFVCWGLSTVLAGQNRREIAKNLTDAERRTLDEMQRSYGRKVGYFFAIPIAIISVSVSYFFDKSLAIFICSMVVTSIVASPFLYRMSQSIRDFHFQTEYAKKTF